MLKGGPSQEQQALFNPSPLLSSTMCILLQLTLLTISHANSPSQPVFLVQPERLPLAPLKKQRVRGEFGALYPTPSVQ